MGIALGPVSGLVGVDIDGWRKIERTRGKKRIKIQPIWSERRDCTGEGRVGNRSGDEPPDRSADQPRDQLVAGDLIAALLSRLRPRSRRIIHSFFLEEKTMEQVGQEVGISQSGVSPEINRLMVLLSEMATNHEHRCNLPTRTSVV